MPVKRWEIVCGVLGAVLLCAAFTARWRDDLPRHEATLDAEGFRVPVTVLMPRASKPIGAAVVLHGLSANRGVMMSLSRALAQDGIAVYSVDLSGHGDNTDPFSFQNVEHCAAAVVGRLASDGRITPERTVLIGHSMGADVAIRMTPHFSASATVGISPGPLVIPPAFEKLRIYEMPKQLPRNLLQLVASADLPLFEWAARRMMEESGGGRESAEDFREGRAMAVSTIPWTTHTGLVFNPAATRQTLDWARRAWGEPPSRWRPNLRPALQAGAIAGIVLLFPVLASVLAMLAFVTLGSQPEDRAGTALRWRMFIPWFAACCIAVALLRFTVPLSFLRIETGAYLASYLLLVSFAYVVIFRRIRFSDLTTVSATQGRVYPLSVHSFMGPATGAILGLLVILGAGTAVRGELGDLWMNGARWWRFGVLVPVLLPFFFWEEALLDSPSRIGHKETGFCDQTGCKEHEPLLVRARREAWRVSMFFVLRGIMWLSMLGGLFFLNSREVLVVAMGLVFIVFSAFQRLGADMVRRRFGSIGAAATFSAILGAWFIAGVFPLR